jgi:hypothetical protein
MHCCFHVFFITRYHPTSAIVFFGCLSFLSVKNGLNLQADELRWAVLLALDVEEKWLPKYIDAKLKAAAESIQYEDWAVDYNLLVIGEKLGKGSSGQLYRGKYMSQDVAIKMIALDNDHDMDAQGADSLRAFPASELLHTFKQEVSIMR